MPPGTNPTYDRVYKEVPSFAGAQDDYKQYRLRATLYHQRRKLESKEKQATLELVGSLTEAAWDAVE
eukprot:10867458-Prorocentrum_lima.AAC.1